ncbi:pirin-like protein At1g50590 [Lolium rigidum]|uniref:pirin-like protein At1g50590 n=1 Tax=Lolium rigidum TaxID=89674 RepID=UPI001F5C9B22|nr:pirin-like protein At1g50590 [Lolium rigidum]
MSTAAVEVPRQVARKFLARPQHEGVGAVVRRSIGRFELRYFDPFLVLDEFSVSAPAGFPDHPHRGFETVTYMLEGAVTHEDFEGHRGTIKAGDVQWMTAGRGIVHSEMPAAPGTSRGLQLWVNLASHNKMIEPGYQEIQSKDIASTTSADGGVTVRVIAGQAMGARSQVSTRTPTMYLDFTVRPHSIAPARQPVPASWNALVYVLEGEASFIGGAGEKAVGAHHLVLLGQGGDGVEVWNRSDRPLRFLLLAGEPIGEPVAQLGPFVMNTEEEIDATVNDFELCINGFEKAKHWKSQAMIALDLE